MLPIRGRSLQLSFDLDQGELKERDRRRAAPDDYGHHQICAPGRLSRGHRCVYSAPQVLEWLGAHGRVSNRVGDAGVAEIVLQPAGIHSLSRQGKAGAVATHVDMDRERQFGSLASPLDHSANSHAPEWLPAFIDKHIGRAWCLLTLQSSEANQFVALQVVHAVSAALEPADGDGAFRSRFPAR